MRVFSITEAQLDELADLNLEYVADVERMQELVAQVKTQPVTDTRAEPSAVE